MTSLCIDIGATKVLIGILENDFEKTIKKNTERFLQNIEKELETLKKNLNIENVLVATAGPIDKKDGVIYPPNLSANKIKIFEPFKDLFQKPIIINDCNAAALGEYTYGKNSAENLLYLTLSTGIGAGLIADGSLIKGSTDNFAEVGHMKIADEGKCGCGQIGHWEALCSGENIPKLAEQEIGKSFENSKDFFDQYRNGNPELEIVMDKVTHYNAIAISNLINLYDPAHISIGGSMGLKQFDLLVKKSKKRIKEKVIYNMPTIEKSSLGEEVVLQGLKSMAEKNQITK